MGIGKTFKKAVGKAGHTLKNAASSALVQRAGAIVAPITLLPALANRAFRTNTGPIYATYAAIGAGALGGAAAGLTGKAVVAAGSSPVTGLLSSLLGKAGGSGAAQAAAAVDPWTDTGGPGGGGGGGDGGYGSGIGSQAGGVPVWAYVAAGAAIIITAVIVALRGKKKSHV